MDCGYRLRRIVDWRAAQTDRGDERRRDEQGSFLSFVGVETCIGHSENYMVFSFYSPLEN